MNVLEQTQESLKNAITEAVVGAALAEETAVPAIHIEEPKEKEHGDFATNIAMQLARIAKKAPRQIAEDIVQHFDKETAGVSKLEIAGPGFINFFMKEAFLGDIIKTILQDQKDYGKTASGNGEKIQVEFVSVNPTGDLHLGHARGAAFGDVLCNTFEAAGYEVEREYYINDAGNQIDQLALSINARYLQALGYEKTMPKDGYFGKDIVEIGELLAENDGDSWLKQTDAERVDAFRAHGLQVQLKKIEQVLEQFGVHFDYWFSEQSLYENKQVLETLTELRDKGYIYDQEGATWFQSTAFGDDKDRVLVKQDGTYTYLTPDIAYHKNKLERGFDKIINVWGADHHGYVPRMTAAIQALGYPKEKLDVQIIQMVNVLEDGEIVRMSKRTGKAVTLKELIEEVGVDAVRYFFVMRSNDAKLDFDMDLARSKSNENPVFYIQYAHARICTMLKQAKEKGMELDDTFDVTQLRSEKESSILKHLASFPQLVADAAKREEPYKVTQYVYDLASLLHRFYNAEKVIDPENIERTKARMALMKAVQITIQNAMHILGVSAPEKM
ncbi:MAG TPA: arginine--tRNA ligase [Pseudogracilibacillus sp.]|nr:arginine--tRNA ligase [Pseudogracilibacillus sp.]